MSYPLQESDLGRGWNHRITNPLGVEKPSKVIESKCSSKPTLNPWCHIPMTASHGDTTALGTLFHCLDTLSVKNLP